MIVNQYHFCLHLNKDQLSQLRIFHVNSLISFNRFKTKVKYDFSVEYDCQMNIDNTTIGLDGTKIKKSFKRFKRDLVRQNQLEIKQDVQHQHPDDIVSLSGWDEWHVLNTTDKFFFYLEEDCYLNECKFEINQKLHLQENYSIEFQVLVH